MTKVEQNTEKNKLVSVVNPIGCYQVLVANASPEYLVTLHKLLGTIAEAVGDMKPKAA